MSRQNDEQKYKAPTKGKGRNGPNAAITYRPTTTEREEIRRVHEDMVKVLEGLAVFVECGHKLSIGYSESTHSTYATLREGNKPFEEAVAVTAWHSDLTVALACLFYYTQVHAPDFPNGVQLAFESDQNW